MQFIILFLSFFNYQYLFAESKIDLDWSEHSVFIISNEIHELNLFPIDSFINYQNKEKSIKMIVNSQGGLVNIADQIVAQMIKKKENGYVIECFIPLIAASAATMIAAECDKIYLNENSYMMWHQARPLYKKEQRKAVFSLIGADWTDDQEDQLIKSTKENDLIYDKKVIETFNFDKDKYYVSKDREDFLPAKCLIGFNKKNSVFKENNIVLTKTFKLNDDQEKNMALNQNSFDNFQFMLKVNLLKVKIDVFDKYKKTDKKNGLCDNFI